MSGLTHLDEQGHARMVDVGAKAETARVAIASGRIRMNEAALAAIRDGAVPKGDVLAAARIAGIMAAKKTADLAPALVLAMQLMMGALFGILGLALADPMLAMLKVLLERLAARGAMAHDDADMTEQA